MTTALGVRLLMAVTLAVGATGCTNSAPNKPEQADVSATEQALAAVEAGWNQAFHTKNLEAVLAPYASDAVLVLPGLPLQTGTSAIRNVYTKAFEDPNFDLTLTIDTVKVAQSGELAFTQGHFAMKGTDSKTKQPTTAATGSYLTVYQKQSDGNWKAIQDWAAANPPSAPTE